MPRNSTDCRIDFRHLRKSAWPCSNSRNICPESRAPKQRHRTVILTQTAHSTDARRRCATYMSWIHSASARRRFTGGIPVCLRAFCASARQHRTRAAWIARATNGKDRVSRVVVERNRRGCVSASYSRNKHWDFTSCDQLSGAWRVSVSRVRAGRSLTNVDVSRVLAGRTELLGMQSLCGDGTRG